MGILNRITAGLAIITTAVGITSAAAEEAPLHAQIKTDDPQIVKCIEKAIDTVKIQGAEKYIYAPHNSASNVLLMNADTGEINSNGWTHSMGAKATHSDNIGPDYNISFATNHDGSLNPNVIDAVNADIRLNFNTESNTITNRSAGLYVADFGTKYSDTDHGQWVVDSAQTLEATFGDCMGLTPSPNRPVSAATSVVDAPSFIPK